MNFVDSDLTKMSQKLDFCEFCNFHMKNMCEITNIHETNLGNDLKIKSKQAENLKISKQKTSEKNEKRMREKKVVKK